MDIRTETHIILAENLKKSYVHDHMADEAIRGIDLAIHQGEFTAIIGPSGSGKTTFLNLISGLDSPTEGRILLDGKPISEMKGNELSDFRRDNIGFIFQAYNLIPVLSVEENIEYVMILQGIPKKERHERVMEILKNVGLEDYSDRMPLNLSGGQQQRVAIARAMVTKPSIILADEPTANLDSVTGAALMDLMHDLNHKTKMTFVFSTHDPMVIERAERILTLKDGKIVNDKNKFPS